MNNKSSIATIQSFVLIGAALYIVLPDLFFGPIDDSVVALIAGITELVLGYAKSRIPASSPISPIWPGKPSFPAKK